MSWTRVSAVLPAVLAACAKVSTVGAAADAGPEQPTVAQVEPTPGPAPADARFVVHFSSAMDEGQLLAASGRSETVALAAEADVERAAAALAHSPLSAHERTLLVPAAAEVASDRSSITLTPDQPLPAGNFYLLVSPRLKDDQGRKLAGNGARFEYQIAAPPKHARLLSPAAGAQAPTNLAVVRASADSGRVSLLAPDGTQAAAADAQGEVALSLSGPLAPGARFVLALDGVADDAQFFTVAPCARTAAPAFQGGSAQLAARDTSVDVAVMLDWPALIEVRVGSADQGEPCSGPCVTAKAEILCAPPACGPQTFACSGAVRVGGLNPATAYALRVVAQDDEGFSDTGPLQPFSTVAPLPRVLISEVKVSPSTGEYVELLNLGPGAADLGSFALVGPDGVVRPLLAGAPPLPVLLAPGARALAVGSSFDATLYSTLPPQTPVLRAKTKRLLGRGLAAKEPQAFQLGLDGQVPVELADFPGGITGCSTFDLQRDETVPPDGQATWSCGPDGGTPGLPP